MDIVIHLFFNKPVTDTTCILGNCSGMMMLLTPKQRGLTDEFTFSLYVYFSKTGNVVEF